MPPRLSTRPSSLKLLATISDHYVCSRCRYASLVAATTPAPSSEQILRPNQPIHRFPALQPPSLKRPDFRKTQLHRQYQSLLRSSPLILLFQHNNVKAAEWIGIQRELATALKKVDAELASGSDENQFIGQSTRLQVVQTGIFASALRVVQFFHPTAEDQAREADNISGGRGTAKDPGAMIHGLSYRAWRAGRLTGRKHGLEALMSGPIAVLALPIVSPQHVKAALSILAPNTEIPAPKKRVQPSLYEAPVPAGLQKLMLLGARIEGKAFDFDEARQLASIEGGMAGLRAQLVAMLQGIGGTLTSTLESAGRSLYITFESRRTMLEEADKGQRS